MQVGKGSAKQRQRFRAIDLLWITPLAIALWIVGSFIVLVYIGLDADPIWVFGSLVAAAIDIVVADIVHGAIRFHWL